MRFKTLCFLLSFVSCKLCAQSPQADASGLFVQEDLKLVSSAFSFTEGCSPDRAGNVFFTDQPNDQIWKYDLNGKLSLFLHPSGRANGTYFDHKGNLLTCSDEHGELWAVNAKATVKTLLAGFEGKQFNGPNDLWVNLNGDIYFTDPYYQRDYWTRTSAELENNVYYLPKGKKTAQLALTGLIRPNGIVGTPDGKYLYIADIGAGKTYKYTIGKNGQLDHRQLIIEQGSDGMTLDEKGNIYLTTKTGVLICSPEGKMIDLIKVPSAPSNVCFAGRDKNILFITARKSVYVIPMKTKGIE
ncbi:SMP-30/gluconolactonase/LRE family protein [Pedobacter nutrimenti]|uniref:SMP-30/gluconolactonase/LRE family protein n=1 Tax=Pedobacter nutrimenti TaxID=1241337 RepID=UPI000DA1ED92|nr:SMP-30/gluconolactonase/LRE family protein [Pedobacter nutrimenti]